VKRVIRQNIKEQRAELDAAWCEQTSAEICTRIQGLDAFVRAETVGIYLALPGEVILDEIVLRCREWGKRVCVPVFDEAAQLCVMAEWHSNVDLVSGKWDVLEPPEHRLVADEAIDLMLVPGVAFDKSGERLGRGGGYYDRMLVRSKAYHLGVAFDFQLVEALSPEPHDIAMDLVVTEHHFYGRASNDKQN
jgi:5-formyltetrahydrofolate cyclo-ligase